jgi:hypothetical protein
VARQKKKKNTHLLFCSNLNDSFSVVFFPHIFLSDFVGNVDDRVETLNAEITTSTMTPSDKVQQPKEKVEKEKEQSKAADETSTTTPSPSPILAFKVTFPPRPSSTLPPPPPTPTFLLRRFPTNRPTARPTAPTTPPRSFNSKFNKPAINNLVGVPAPFATGINKFNYDISRLYIDSIKDSRCPFLSFSF